MFNLSKNIIKQALDLSPVATLIVDLNAAPQTIQYANQAFEALSGYDAGEIVGRHWDGLTGAAEGDHANREIELSCHPRLGAADTLRFELYPLYDGPGTARYWLATEQKPVEQDDSADPERDTLIAVLREARNHLRRADGRDSTTGVLNRRAFDDLMHRDWVLARREQRPLALMVFQLDSFDAYCDVFGRHAADACLRKVAHAITGSLRRAGDLTARYADDRFAVLMGQGNVSQAAELAAQIADKVRELAIHHPRSREDRFVTASWGVAVIDADRLHTQPDLIDLAEVDLQEARRNGGRHSIADKSSGIV